jgi:hypothetical protein
MEKHKLGFKNKYHIITFRINTDIRVSDNRWNEVHEENCGRHFQIVREIKKL